MSVVVKRKFKTRTITQSSSQSDDIFGNAKVCETAFRIKDTWSPLKDQDYVKVSFTRIFKL